MYGNGVRTGMESIAAVHRPILQALHLAMAVCTVAVAGNSMLRTAEYRVDTAAPQAVGATTLVCASPFLSKHMNPEIVLS